MTEPVGLKKSITDSNTEIEVPTYTESGSRRAQDVNLAAGVETTAYDELAVSQPTAKVTGNAVYGFIPSNFRTFTDGAGTVVVEDGVFKCTSGTTVFGYGTLQSFRSVGYKTGQGVEFRFAALFPSNAALTWIGAGAISISSEASFGYNGTSFGVWHRYNGEAEIRTFQVTGAAGGSENATVTINGDAYTVPLTAGTVQLNAKEIADYLEANATGYTASQNDDTVTVAAQSDGAKSLTWSFSSATATATVTQVTAGVTKTSDFVAMADWNGTTFEDFDPSKGNSYRIIYKNGYGDIDYFINEPNENKFIKVHTVRWGNTQTTPNFNNPSLRCGCYAASIGSTTSVSVKCAYLSGFIDGILPRTRNPRAYSNTKSIGTTATNILTLRNKRVYNNKYNQVEIRPEYITLANDGTKPAIFEIRANPTVAGDTNFQDPGTNLVSEVDVAGTTVTANGRLLATFSVARLSSIQVPLEELQIAMPPTLRLVISGKMSSGSSSDLSASLVWYEDV